ncbi:hypothetical protein [Nocardia amamiensis]|uniref:hypothetical protein n=1 Tax=Nocardia amamiensis TaxID=404578 RepID=UPI002B4B4E52|nr:hypothetical protein [Nocardia amamiensis]
MFLQTLAIVAEFEANLNHLRTREGTAKAGVEGRLESSARRCRMPRCPTGRDPAEQEAPPATTARNPLR